MKKILLAILVLIGINSFGQVPTGYQKRIVNERIQGSFMVDTAFNMPRYYDTTAANLHKRSDTCGAIFFSYADNSIWVRACSPKRWIQSGTNFGNADLTFTGDRTHNANFEDAEIYNLKSWATIAGTSPRYTTLEHDSTYLKIYYRKDGQISELMLRDSILFKPADGVMNIDSLRDAPNMNRSKVMVRDTVTGAWYEILKDSIVSGAINSGTTGKPAYYVGATTLDDFAAVDYATSGTNVKITALNTTDVNLLLQEVGSQTANPFELRNSATNLLTYFEADGDIIMTTNSGKQITGTGDELVLRQTGDALGESGLKIRNRAGSAGALFYNAAIDLVDMGFLTSTAVQHNFRLEHRGGFILSGNTTGEFQFIEGLDPTPYFRIGELEGQYVASLLVGGLTTPQSPDRRFQVEVSDASTTSVTYVSRFSHTSNSGFPNNGVGVGVEYEIMNASGANIVSSTQETFFVDATNTSEDADIVFKAIRAGTLTEAARMTGTGAIRLGEISAPSTPASATALLYTKSDGLFYGKDDAGVESRLSNLGGSKGAFLESPTSADTIDVWQTPVAITITSLKAILRGSSPSVTYNIGFGTNIQSPTAVFTADITCTSITTGCSNSSGFNDATIPAGSFIWIYTNAASGTIRSISFTINYTED